MHDFGDESACRFTPKESCLVPAQPRFSSLRGSSLSPKLGCLGSPLRLPASALSRQLHSMCLSSILWRESYSALFAHRLDKPGNATAKFITLIYLVYTHSGAKIQEVGFTEQRHERVAELPEERNIHGSLFMLRLSSVLSQLQTRFLHR